MMYSQLQAKTRIVHANRTSSLQTMVVRDYSFDDPKTDELPGKNRIFGNVGKVSNR